MRRLPALLYRRLLGARKAAIAGLLQATSRPRSRSHRRRDEAVQIAGGLPSVVVFAAVGLALLRPAPDVEDAPLVAM